MIAKTPMDVVGNNSSKNARAVTSISAVTVTTSRKDLQRLSPPSSKRLRLGLLNKLGIVDERLLLPRGSSSSLGNPSETTSGNNNKSVLGPQVRILKAPLKTSSESKSKRKNKNTRQKQSGPSDPGLLGALGSFFKVGSPTDSSAATETSSSSAPSEMMEQNEQQQQQRPRNLTFNETVSVVHIPRRDEYSQRIKSHLWHGTEVLQENIMRNTIEYAADGWDWQNVLEEDEHIQCPESGELIHPVHCEIARMIRQERGLPPVEGEENIAELLQTR